MQGSPLGRLGVHVKPDLTQGLKAKARMHGPSSTVPALCLTERSTKHWQAGGPGLREVERALSASRPGQLHCARLAWGPGLPSH